MDEIDINISGTVPVIQHVQDGEIFSNDPGGWVLLAVSEDGTSRELDRGPGPVSGRPAPLKEADETYVFTKP